MYKSHYALLFILSLITLSCDNRPVGTYRNQNVDRETSEVINALNTQVVDHLMKGDRKALVSLMSDDLKVAVDSNLDAFIELAQRTIESGGFDVVDAYHRISASDSEVVVLISGSNSPEDYILQYQSLTKESFVSVLAPHRQGDIYLLTNFYGLYDGQWKLNIVQYERLTISGYSAVEHFELAAKELGEGHLINALNHMAIGQSCMHPAGDFWNYRIQHEMELFSDSITGMARKKYPMPLEMNGIPTKPQIFKVGPQRVDNQICTMIRYKTSINIRDTVALAAENEVLHKLAPSLFPGIDKDVSFIFYRAFNEFPDEKIATPYFGFVRPLDEKLL